MSTRLPGQEQFLEIAALIDALPHPVVVRVQDAAAIQYNQAFSAHTGLSGTEDWTVAVHPDDRDAAIAHFAAVGTAAALSLRLRDRAGIYRRFLAATGPARGSAAGSYACLVLTVQDQSSAPTEAVAGSIAMRDAMLDAIPERVELIAADGRLLHVNRAGRGARAGADTDGSGAWLDGLPAAIRRRGGQALGQARQGKPARFRVVTGGPGLKPRHWENTLVPMSDESGATVAVVNVARDVTAQREAEERFRNAGRVDGLTRV